MNSRSAARTVRRTGAAWLLVFSVATLMSAIESAEFVTPETRVRLVSAWSRAPTDGDPRLGLAFTLAPGWHVYWKNPGDAGYPPAFEPAAGSDLVAADLRYPAPERFELPGGLVALGYAEAMIYPLDARLKPGLAGSARIAGQLDFLVCAESCIPYRTELSFALPLGDATAAAEDPAVAPELDRWLRALPQAAAESGLVTARLTQGTGNRLLLNWRIRADGIEAIAPDLFFDIHPLLAFERPRFTASADGPGFEIGLRPLDAAAALPDRLHIGWTATGFARAGEPLAWEGHLELEPPRDAVAAGVLLKLALALVVLSLATALVLRRRRTSSSNPDSLEASR